MKTWGYRIASVVMLGVFALVWAASILGWGVRASASTAAERERVRTHSARIGGYVSGGPHFGK